MTKFTLHTLEAAPEASRPQLAEIQKSLGFLPNMYAGLAESPAGIAACTAAAGTVNAWLLWRYLRRRTTWSLRPGWPRYLLRVGVACAAMVAVLWLARHHVGTWAALAPHMRVAHLAWVVPLGMVTYIGTLLLAGLRPRHLREA